MQSPQPSRQRTPHVAEVPFIKGTYKAPPVAAPEFTLPNVRRLFIPDPGHMLVDVDLSGADAQVVAWESGEDALKQAFLRGEDIHNFNGRRIWGDKYEPKKRRRKLTWRDECKRAVHGTNYVAGIRALQSALGWTTPEVETFKRTWFKQNPGILAWHERIQKELSLRKMVRNAFGYRIVYFDRIDNLLPEALAWIPQSTIANVTSRGAVNLHRSCPWATLLLQVHDSIVFQVPYHRLTPASFAQIKSALEVSIPFRPEPRIIPWGIKISKKSWGELEEVKWEKLL